MRLICLVVLLLASAAVPLSADLSGSTVELIEPSSSVDPGETCTFVFRVVRDLSSEERVTGVYVLFPYGLVPDGSTMGYAEIVPGRPMFDSMVYALFAIWADGSVCGGIHMGETTEVWVDATMDDTFPPGTLVELEWHLSGASGGTSSGTCCISTPVEPRTWGAIKALYLEKP